MVQKYSIFAAIQANDVMRNAYLINLVRVLCGLPVSGDSTESTMLLNDIYIYLILASQVSGSAHSLHSAKAFLCISKQVH